MSTGPVTDHPDVCSRCADLALQRNLKTADPRPPIRPLGESTEAVCELLLANFDGAVACLRIHRDLYIWLWILDEKHRKKLVKQLAAILHRRLKEELPLLSVVPRGELRACRHGDRPLYKLLRRRRLREALEDFFLYREQDYIDLQIRLALR